MTFEEIMEFHPENPEVYKEIKAQMHHMIPFVGAGLSAFRYGTWGGVLNDIAHKISPSSRTEFERIKNDVGYEEACSYLVEKRSRLNFNHDIEKIFGARELDEEKKCVVREATTQAVALMPYLFNETVLTTNFEKVLEYVYEDFGKPFHEQGIPGDIASLSSAIRANSRRLIYKFHGDILKLNTIIFDKDQYDRAYIKDSHLIEELKLCIHARPLLFLGCGLAQDRTMTVLKDTLNMGIVNYAIKDCKNDEEARYEEFSRLGAMHIKPILYPSGEYDSVRVILARLLEDLDPKNYLLYKNKLSAHGGTARSPIKPLKPLKYDANSVNFIGREGEMQALLDFCNTPRLMTWWAITGSGGIGKSRLAYEFLKIMKAHGWSTYFVNGLDYHHLQGMASKFIKKTLVVLDYVNSYTDEIVAFLSEVMVMDKEVRVIFVEREGDNFSEALWIQSIDFKFKKGQLKNACYKNEFLKLRPLSPQHIKDLMANYAQFKKKDMSPQTLSSLYDRLLDIDKDLVRPLYALLLVEVYHEEMIAWDKAKIIDELVQREEYILHSWLGKDEQMVNPVTKPLYNRLICFSTLEKGLVLNGEEQDYLGETLQELIDDHSLRKFRNFLKQVGLMDKASRLYAYEPDIVGEYYILKKIVLEEEDKDFVEYYWQHKPRIMLDFVHRLVMDFNEYFLEPTEIKEKMIRDIMLHANDDEGTMRYSLTFLAMMTLARIKWVNDIVLELSRRIYKDQEKIYNDEKMASIFSTILFNVSVKFKENAETLLEELKTVRDKYHASRKIALTFSKAAANMSIEDKRRSEEFLAMVKEVKDNYPNDDDIALRYGRIATHICYDDEKRLEEILTLLDDLKEEHKDSVEIARLYAKIALNVSVKHDKRSEELLEVLKNLYHDHRQSHEIALVYGKMALKMSIRNEGLAEELLPAIREVYHDHADNNEIALRYARLIFGVSVDNKSKAEDMFLLLKELKDKHFKDARIALEYAKLAVNISLYNKSRSETLLVALEDLINIHKEDSEIALRYAKVAINICTADESRCEALLLSVGALKDRHHESAEIALRYSRLAFKVGLLNKGRAEEMLSSLYGLKERHQDVIFALIYSKLALNISFDNESRSEALLASLEEVKNKYQDDIDIALVYAELAFNVSIDNSNHSETLLTSLKELKDVHKDHSEIALYYARMAFNLSVENESRSTALLDSLAEVVNDHKDNSEIALIYGNLALNVSIDNKSRSVALCESLRLLVDRHPDNSEIALRYAELGFLASTDNQARAEKILSSLKNIKDRFKENSEIAVEYAKILNNVTVNTPERSEELFNAINQVYNQFSGNSELAMIAINTALYLSVQPDYQSETLLVLLKKVNVHHQTNDKIALKCGELAYNIGVGSGKNLETSLSIVEELKNLHKKSQEIAFIFACLALMYSYDRPDRSEELLEALESLNAQHKNHSGIALRYAKLAFYVSVDNEDRSEELLVTLSRLKDQFKEESEIAYQYVKLAIKLQIDGCLKSEALLLELNALKNRHQDHSGIALVYGRLALVVALMNEDVAHELITELHHLKAHHIKDGKSVLQFDELISYANEALAIEDIQE